MSCGCGGACCGQKGLGFLQWFPESGGGNEDFWSDWQDSGGGDFWGFDNPYWSGDYSGADLGLPNWQDTRDFGGYYVDPITGAILFSDSERFLPAGQQSQDTGFNWQGLLDWWAELTGGYTGGVIQPPSESPSIFPPFSGYCPPNTYCADFPTCSQCIPLNETPAQKAKRLAEQAAKTAAQQQKQQQQQGCPPNTGLVKNAQGRCVCPPGYAPNAQLKKCVLVNASLAQQSANGLPSDWWKYALLALGVVYVAKR